MKKNTLDFFDLERAPFARPASHADMYMGDSVSGAISNIYHHICEGEIFALTGPPGSGKSLTIDRTMCAQGVRPVRPLTDRSKLTIRTSTRRSWAT